MSTEAQERSKGIGIMNEKSLHAAMKEWYSTKCYARRKVEGIKRK